MLNSSLRSGASTALGQDKAGLLTSGPVVLLYLISPSAALSLVPLMVRTPAALCLLYGSLLASTMVSAGNSTNLCRSWQSVHTDTRNLRIMIIFLLHLFGWRSHSTAFHPVAFLKAAP